MKLIINRSNWLRGQGHDFSYLLRPWDKKMCCLGFYLKALGISAEELIDKKQPSDVKSEIIPKWLLEPADTSPYPDIGHLVKWNDYQRIKDDFREKEIKKYFARHNVEVVFED